MTRARIVDDNGAAVFVRYSAPADRLRGYRRSWVVIAGKLETFVGRNGHPGSR